MKPTLHAQTDKSKPLSKLIDCISRMERSAHFQRHLGQSQSAQQKIVANFQRALTSALATGLPHIKWQTEYRPGEHAKDAIDIFGQARGYCVVVEIDKTRTDQISKKFVSRAALLCNQPVFYISLCVPGTKSMSVPECEKYFAFCSKLSVRLGNHYAAFIVSRAP